MTDLELALRTPGVVLLDPRHCSARIERSIINAHGGQGGFLGGLLGRIGVGRAKARGDEDHAPTMARPNLSWAETLEYGEGYAIVDGVAVIDVSGILTPDGYYDWWSECWVAGYAQIGAAFEAAQDDERVRAILMRYDTPGGLVDGCFDLAAAMRARNGANGGKPVWAHARMACSAGYALASSADRLLATAEGEVGSIGVVIVHTDYSEWLAENGIKVTAIQSGEHKTDGAPWKPLGEDVQAYWQAIVDQIARKFAGTVEAGRGLGADSIAALGARWFMAEHDDPALSGLSLGLVDEVAPERAAFEALIASLSDTTGGAPAGTGSSLKRATTSTKETEMSLAEQIAALRAKAAKGDKSAKAELKKLGIALKAKAEDEKDPEAEEEEKDEAEGEEEEPEAEEDEKDPEAEEDDKEEAEGEEEEPEAKATGTKAGFRLLQSKEAKGREALAGRLAEKVAAKKLSYGEARDMLAAAPRKSRLGDAMAGRDRNPGRDAPNAGKAGAGLAAAVDRMNAKKAGAR